MSWWRSTKRDAVEAPRDRLLEVARNVADACSWTWLEPVEIRLESEGDEGRVWVVQTNCGRRGMNIRIAIRESDFSVVRAGFLPR
jgi:hypothetical protein